MQKTCFVALFSGEEASGVNDPGSCRLIGAHQHADFRGTPT